MLFFLHIPKNSGSTLNHLVAANYASRFKVSWNPDSPDHHSRLLSGHGAERIGAADVVTGHFPYGLHEVLADGVPYRYLTMLRDPLRRTISSFNYLRHDSTFVEKDPDLKAYIDGLSLEAFCERFHERIPNHVYVDNCQVRYLSGCGGDKPFGAIDEGDLETAQRHLEAMVFGLTEQFNRSVLHFRAALGWSSVGYLKQRVASRPAATPSAGETAALRARNTFDLRLHDYATREFTRRTGAISAAELRRYENALARAAALAALRRLPRRAARRFRSLLRK